MCLRDTTGREVARADGQTRGDTPIFLDQPGQGPDWYPSYEIITVHGVTELTEHRDREPIFYVSDDEVLKLKKLGIR